MIFKELVLQNFGHYAGRHVINLQPETEEETRPIILFGGMNGGGKTTLMDAIRLALYGQRAQCSTRGNLSYSDFLTQSVNSLASPIDKARIELVIKQVRNDRWIENRIVRSWTRNPKDGKDSLGILEKEWPDTALANTWDEYIETLLPLGISNLFLFDGEQVKELAELEIPPLTVVDAIQALLGLELAERLAVDLDILVNRKRKAIANSSQLADIEDLETKINQYKQTCEEASEKLFSLTQKLEQAEKKYQKASDKFRLEGGKIASQRSQLEGQKRSLEAEADRVRQEMRSLAAGILPLILISPILNQAKQQGEKELEYQHNNIANAVIEKRDRQLLDYLAHLALTSEQLDRVELFLQQENHRFNQISKTDEVPWLGIEAEGLKQLETTIDYQLPLQLKQAEAQLEKRKQLETEINNLERQIAVAAPPEAYQKLDEALQKSLQELTHCQSAVEMARHRQAETEKDYNQAKKELQKYSEQTVERVNDEHLIKSAAKAKTTLHLFKERLTLKKLNKLEGEVTECFRYLLHKSDLVHRVAIDSNNFMLSYTIPTVNPFLNTAFPQEKKQLLAIAFLWGLARVSGRSLPVAIDTPLGRLDSSHRNNLVERYFPTASHQVILLATDTEIGSAEVELLRKQKAIARNYLLKYDSQKRQTTVREGYFW